VVLDALTEVGPTFATYLPMTSWVLAILPECRLFITRQGNHIMLDS
jgi:hypothetical protein